jgi:hypothetical protein
MAGVLTGRCCWRGARRHEVDLLSTCGFSSIMDARPDEAAQQNADSLG